MSKYDLRTTLDMMAEVPPGIVVVSESGIGTPEDVDRLGASGVDAILVGEALLRHPSPLAHAGTLTGRTKAPRRG